MVPISFCAPVAVGIDLELGRCDALCLSAPSTPPHSNDLPPLRSMSLSGGLWDEEVRVGALMVGVASVGGKQSLHGEKQ
jgi:hypothetical protein